MKNDIILSDVMNHRIPVFRILLLITGIALMFFACLNFYFNTSKTLISVEFAFAIFSFIIAISMPYFNKHRHYLTLIIKMYTVIISIFMCYLFVIAFQNSIQMWIISIPLISYLLLGEKLGFIITLISVFINVVGFYLNFHEQLHLIEITSIYNIFGIFSMTWLITHIYEHNTQKFQQKMAKIARTDPLTKLFNRSIVNTIFEENKKGGLSIIIFDIDFFKKVNDNYGHEVGDIVIVDFAKQLEKFFTISGYVFRIGGEEFCVLLPKHSLEKSNTLAEEFRLLIENHEICSTHSESTEIERVANKKIKITFSAGIANMQAGEKTRLTNLMNIADQNLYQAKQSGRNKVFSCIQYT